MQTMIKAADEIALFLKEKQIKHVFGIIGSGNAHIFDAINRLDYTEIVCVHHEQAAVMAAITYYRISGVVSVALVTTGAGSTNAVTGVVSAWMDSMPVLIISGNENSKFTTQENLLRIWGIQGYDSSAMVEKVTKYATRVMDPLQVESELEKAYGIASSGRFGPCWLDIPMNIQAAPVDTLRLKTPRAIPHEMHSSAHAKLITDPKLALDTIVEKLKQASRPVIWLGNGIRLAGAEALVKTLVETLKCPVLVTWTGIDLIDSNHPLVYGRAGIYGQRAANFVLQNCDFLVTIGTRLAIPQVGYDITELTRAAEIAVVDIDAQELSKYPQRFNYPICMDAGEFMRGLLEKAGEGFERKDWISRCNDYRERYPFIGPEHADKNGFMNIYRFMDRLNALLHPKQIITTDMGTALLCAHQALKIKDGQRLMTSLGLGEMGYGLPASIGASFGRDKAEVLCLNCDGGMMMNLQELQTIVHHQLPIKIIIFNNDGYLMIKHTQKALFTGRYSGTDKKSGVSCPDYSAVAKAFGIPSYTIRNWEEFDENMPKVQNEIGSVICEVFMDPEQFFLPKLSLALQPDGSIISPPMEDLSPLLPRDELKGNMIIGLHPKSEAIK
ncbi:MAG: thiamine pyrophosphate-binding protein [Gammaproteobacteria bacterium]|nr:thiamine pyrophosphate-binding protein [Gammaproteobacteria bacterium]